MSDDSATIITVLTPYLGQNMARAALKTQCGKLAIDMARVTPSQLDKLAEAIGTGLSAFIGQAKASAVTAELKKALGLA